MKIKIEDMIKLVNLIILKFLIVKMSMIVANVIKEKAVLSPDKKVRTSIAINKQNA